jgi:hypothetical protein
VGRGLKSIGEKDNPFLNVVINFRHGEAKIWTMFRADKRFVFPKQARWIQDGKKQNNSRPCNLASSKSIIRHGLRPASRDLPSLPLRGRGKRLPTSEPIDIVAEINLIATITSLVFYP